MKLVVKDDAISFYVDDMEVFKEVRDRDNAYLFDGGRLGVMGFAGVVQFQNVYGNSGDETGPTTPTDPSGTTDPEETSRPTGQISPSPDTTTAQETPSSAVPLPPETGFKPEAVLIATVLVSASLFGVFVFKKKQYPA